MSGGPLSTTTTGTALEARGLPYYFVMERRGEGRGGAQRGEKETESGFLGRRNGGRGAACVSACSGGAENQSGQRVVEERNGLSVLCAVI